MDWQANFARRMTLMLCAIVLTAIAYFVSSGLDRVWWLVWLAPLPVLLVAPQLGTPGAFTAALFARGLGMLSFWHYLHDIVQFPLWLSLVSIVAPAVIVGLAVALHRELIRKDRPWHAAIAFPAVMVAGEYFFSLWQGTFLSTAYTQLGNLPILQLAAITGLWGVSFVTNLLPSALAALVSAPRRDRLRLASALIVFYSCILSYGMVRLYAAPQNSSSIQVGLVETHSGPDMFPQDPQASMALLQRYAGQIRPLAMRGAQFVVFPEMSALILDSTSAQVDDLFRKSARDSHVQVLLGILHVTSSGAYNEARLYAANGDIETVYRKHHLVPTWESRSTPGTELSVLPQPAGTIGIEICRDMDYPELARRYGKRQVGVVLVPAWDQGINVDAAWHGHLSLMRAVEAGFAMVRDAKNGLLTISDNRGRVLAEVPTRSDGAIITVLAKVPVHHDSTIYQKWGDWFAWLDVVALIAILVTSSRTRLGAPLEP